MASVIVVDGNFTQGDSLNSAAFKASLAAGMKAFGFEVREAGGTSLSALLAAFRKILSDVDMTYPDYQAFALSPPASAGGATVQVKLTRPRSAGQGLIKFDTNGSAAQPFSIRTRPDTSKVMNVALPIFEQPHVYLGQLVDIIENDLSGDEDVNFLLANTLISRCK